MVSVYSNNTVKVKLFSKLKREYYIYEFSSKGCIIDDYMLYLQNHSHTRKSLEASGYKHANY